MAARVWTQTSGNLWSTAANWDGGISVPATTDTITFDSTSTANCTIDDVGTWSGGTITVAITYTGAITNNVAFSVTSFIMSSGGGSATFTDNAGITVTNGMSINNGHTYNAYSGATNSTRNVTIGATSIFNHNNGTIAFTGVLSPTFTDASGQHNKVTLNIGTNGAFEAGVGTIVKLGANPSTTGSLFRGFNANSGYSGTGTWTHTGTGSAASISLVGTNASISGFSGIYLVNAGFSAASASATIPANMDITFEITSSTNRTFAGNGKTYGNFRRLGAGTGTLTISGSNTFTGFRDNDGTSAHTLTLTAGTTTTISSFTVSGSSGNVVSIQSSSAGTAATLTTTGGAVSCQYLSIKDSTVDASPTWTALDSTSVSGNTNWIFSASVTSNLYGDKFGVAQGGQRSGRFAPAQGL